MIDPVDVYVGRRLREARSTKQWSQDELGKALGISLQQVQKYEKGANRIGASRLWRIAEALDVDIHFFFEGLSENFGEVSVAVLPRKTVTTAALLQQLDDEMLREKMLQLIDAVVRSR